MEGYQICSPPTEAEKGGVLIYVADHLSTKTLKNLDKIMYKPQQLESVFIEICNKNKRNIVIGCIYKHPPIELNDFNENFLDPLMVELSGKDIDLMKMDIDNHTSTCFGSMTYLFHV